MSNNIEIDWMYLNTVVNSDLTDFELGLCTSVNNEDNSPYVLCLMTNNVFGVCDINNIQPGCHIIGKINVSLKTIIKRSLESYMPKKIFILSERNDNDILSCFIENNSDEIDRYIDINIINCARDIIINSKNLHLAFKPIPIDIHNLINIRKLNYVIN
jgi:hypothetical protein